MVFDVNQLLTYVYVDTLILALIYSKINTILNTFTYYFTRPMDNLQSKTSNYWCTAKSKKKSKFSGKTNVILLNISSVYPNHINVDQFNCFSVHWSTDQRICTYMCSVKLKFQDFLFLLLTDSNPCHHWGAH